jgi:hypothetical protein
MGIVRVRDEDEDEDEDKDDECDKTFAAPKSLNKQ